MDERLGALLARWHQWRGGYSHERKFARVAYASPADDDEELERLTMAAVDEAVGKLTNLQQLAVQHVARSQAMGVEVFHTHRLGSGSGCDAICDEALNALVRRLLHSGIL